MFVVDDECMLVWFRLCFWSVVVGANVIYVESISKMTPHYPHSRTKLTCFEVKLIFVFCTGVAIEQYEQLKEFMMRDSQLFRTTLGIYTPLEKVQPKGMVHY